MNNIKKNKFGGKKNDEGGRTTKNTKKKENKGRDLHSQKGTREKIKNIEKSNERKKCESEKNKKTGKKNKKGGQYVYFPEKNVIQFLPYSYPNISNKSFNVYNKLYTGNQNGGNILPQQCSNFNPNMLNREFNCSQPFWNENCT